MNPSSSRALVRRAVSGRKRSRKPWTREAETGEAARRLARRGSASPRRGRGSMPGVLRDGQFPGRGRQKTLGFGPEVGKATAQLAEEIAHVRKVRPELVAVADAAPDNWTFLEKLRPNERAVDFFHACEHLSEVSDRREQLVRKVPRRATTSAARSAIRHLRDKATTEPEVLRRELRFFRKHRRRMRYANLKANGCALRRRPPTRSWSTSA